MPPEFQWLRTPEPERIFTLTGHSLRLTGRESWGSWFEQALVARRQENHAYSAATLVEADPPNWQRGAGPTTYYNRFKFHLAVVTREGGQRVVQLASCLGNSDQDLTFHGTYPVPDGPVRLEVRVRGRTQQFYISRPGANSEPVGPELDASIVSDEGGRGEHGSFTGAFVGMIAYDLTGQGWTADFTEFDYMPVEMGV